MKARQRVPSFSISDFLVHCLGCGGERQGLTDTKTKKKEGEKWESRWRRVPGRVHRWLHGFVFFSFPVLKHGNPSSSLPIPPPFSNSKCGGISGHSPDHRVNLWWSQKDHSDVSQPGPLYLSFKSFSKMYLSGWFPAFLVSWR